MCQKPGAKPLRIKAQTIADWARELGRSEASVRCRLARVPAKEALGPKEPEKVTRPKGNCGQPRGSTNDGTFVKKSRNVEMRHRRLAGATFAELGRAFGMTAQGAGRFCKKMTRPLSEG